MLPREDAPETCAETIHLTAGGEAGRHLSAIVTPLIVHDLPVTVWWPGEPPFGSRAAYDLLSGADRLVVDGSTWNGDGLERMREMAGPARRDPPRDQRLRAHPPVALAGGHRLDLRRSGLPAVPALAAADRRDVRHPRRDRRAGLDEPRQARSTTSPGSPRGSGCRVVKPLAAVAEQAGAARPKSRRRPARDRWSAAGWRPTLSDGRGEVAVVVRPVVSTMPAGTTLRVELLAERRGSELRADVTAEAEAVHVRVWQDGVEVLERRFLAARRGEVDLLAEAIEAGRRDDIATGSLRAAAELAGGAIAPAGATPDGMSEPEIIVVADADAASAAGRATGSRAALRRAVEARGRADWATTGGSTPGRHLPRISPRPHT